MPHKVLVSADVQKAIVSAKRTALVTGGVNGLGWAICQELIASGYTVIAGDVEEGLFAARSAEVPVVCRFLDVTKQESVSTVIDGIVEEYGDLHLLVNNAGITRVGSIENLPWASWVEVLEVNLNGVFRCLQAAGPHMIRAGHGSVVNIASIAAQRGVAGRSPYAATKSVVVSLTRTAAVEWAQHGVRVNAVAPGYTDTRLLQRFVAEQLGSIAPILQRTPMRRLGQPPEIASVVRFLASEEAAFITGQVINVDGGFLADYGVTA